MAPFEAYFFWASILLYMLAIGFYSFSLVFQRERPRRWGMWMMVAGFVAQAMAIGIRWAVTGHVPTIGNYENANIFSFFIVLFTVWFSVRYPAMRVAGVFTLAVAVLTMGFGFMSSPTLSPMVASLKSWWLYVHIFFGWLVTGALTFASGVSVLYLLKEHKERTGEMSEFFRKLPTLQRMDELIYRNVVYGFIAYAAMIGSGAIWAKELWGGYWSWDPVETWSLIAWLVYGLILHMRFTFGWKGSRMAWLVVFALVIVFIVNFGINLAVESSMHIFNVQ